MYFLTICVSGYDNMYSSAKPLNAIVNEKLMPDMKGPDIGRLIGDLFKPNRRLGKTKR